MGGNTPFDLDAYLKRIGHSGGRTPTLEVLQALHRAHAQAIAFENLDPLLGRPVALDEASLQEKLVIGGRGGWCFEQNHLFRSALEAIGFSTTGLAARVLWRQDAGAITPRGHMLLQIDLDEPYIADVGFGGLTLTAPLRLVADIEQHTPHETFRLRALDDTLGGYLLEAKLDESWAPVYRFDLQPQAPADYELTNWYLGNHPGSHFLTSLIAARPHPEGRWTLRNDRLVLRRLDGSSQERRLRSPQEVRGALEDQLGLRVPAGPEVDAALGRLIGVG